MVIRLTSRCTRMSLITIVIGFGYAAERSKVRDVFFFLFLCVLSREFADYNDLLKIFKRYSILSNFSRGVVLISKRARKEKKRTQEKKKERFLIAL